MSAAGVSRSRGGAPRGRGNAPVCSQDVGHIHGRRDKPSPRVVFIWECVCVSIAGSGCRSRQVPSLCSPFSPFGYQQATFKQKSASSALLSGLPSRKGKGWMDGWRGSGSDPAQPLSPHGTYLSPHPGQGLAPDQWGFSVRRGEARSCKVRRGLPGPSPPSSPPEVSISATHGYEDCFSPPLLEAHGWDRDVQQIKPS